MTQPFEFPSSVEVAPPRVPSLVMAPPMGGNTLVLPVVGPPGPQGPAGSQGPSGPPGGSGFEYTQAVPASTWIIDHGLGRKVHVSLFSVGAVVVFADVVHGSVNQTTISFAGPTAGSVVIS